MKNRVQAGFCFVLFFLLFLTFAFILMGSVGAFSAHGPFMQWLRAGIYSFHWKPVYVMYCLLASAFLTSLVALILINLNHEHFERSPSGFSRNLNLINTVLLFSATVFITVVFAFIGVDAHHDGIMFKPAMDVALGKMLFKETFSMYGALTVLLQAAALAVFGKTLIVLRLLTSLFYGLIAVMLYRLFISFLKKWQAVFAVTLWLLMAPFYLNDGGITVLAPWSSVYSLFCQLACVLLCVRYFKNRAFYLVVSCGVFAALTFLFRQPVGITITGTVGATIFLLCLVTAGTRAAFRALLGFVSGFALVIAVFLAYLVLAGSLADWYLQSIAFMGTWNGIETRHNFIHYLGCSLLVHGFPFTKAWVWRFLPWVCGITSIVFSYALLVKKKTTGENLTLFIVAAACLSSWFQYYPVPCNSHLFWAASPMFGLAVYAAWKLAGFCRITVMKAAFFAMLLIVLFGPEATRRISVGFTKAIDNYENKVPAEVPIIKGMIVPRTEAAGYTLLSDTINRYLGVHPRSTVVNLGRDPLFSALAGDRPNAHCAYVNWGKYITGIYPDYYEKVAAFIAQESPLCLVPDDSYDGMDVLGPVLQQRRYRTIMDTEFGFSVMAPSSR
jgi:hypothetical protein